MNNEFLKNEAVKLAEMCRAAVENGTRIAVSGHDMTTEAAVTKLYYLFSKYDDTETVKRLLSENLAGEVSIGE